MSLHLKIPLSAVISIGCLISTAFAIYYKKMWRISFRQLFGNNMELRFRDDPEEGNQGIIK